MQLRLLVILFAGFFFCLGVVSAEEEEAEHAPSKPDEEKAKLIKRPGDYARYRPTMLEICELMDLDGRRRFFYDLLLRLIPKDRECIDCRPLLYPWSTACRPPVAYEKRVKRLKEGEEPPPTPIPVPETIKQRYPNLGILDRLSDMSSRMSLDKRLNRQTLPAIYKFERALRDEKGKTLGEKVYFGIMADYLMYPWQDLIYTLEQEEIRHKKEEAEIAANEASKGFSDRGAQVDEGALEKNHSKSKKPKATQGLFGDD